MSNLWFLNGIKKGIKTEKFPYRHEESPPLWPSRIYGSGEAECPTDAIKNEKWDSEKCIFCRRCLPNYHPNGDQNLFYISRSEIVFKRSFYVFPIDTGSCSGCNMEFFNLFSPQYDANRLGIFMTNTPRHADALVVMGVMTDGMKKALELAYEAMPEPKLVIGLGACALSGGILGNPPLPKERYNALISGCPPSPYTVLKALLEAKKGDNSLKENSGSGTN